jgi:hypothetical protein
MHWLALQLARGVEVIFKDLEVVLRKKVFPNTPSCSPQ